ncbi:MAG: hypothetical protein Tsb005_01810 [Gammaproteobacteria bacterium]
MYETELPKALKKLLSQPGLNTWYESGRLENYEKVIARYLRLNPRFGSINIGEFQQVSLSRQMKTINEGGTIPVFDENSAENPEYVKHYLKTYIIQPLEQMTQMLKLRKMLNDALSKLLEKYDDIGQELYMDLRYKVDATQIVTLIKAMQTELKSLPTHFSLHADPNQNLDLLKGFLYAKLFELEEKHQQALASLQDSAKTSIKNNLKQPKTASGVLLQALKQVLEKQQIDITQQQVKLLHQYREFKTDPAEYKAQAQQKNIEYEQQYMQLDEQRANDNKSISSANNKPQQVTIIGAARLLNPRLKTVLQTHADTYLLAKGRRDLQLSDKVIKALNATIDKPISNNNLRSIIELSTDMFLAPQELNTIQQYNQLMRRQQTIINPVLQEILREQLNEQQWLDADINVQIKRLNLLIYDDPSNDKQLSQNLRQILGEIGISAISEQQLQQIQHKNNEIHHVLATSQPSDPSLVAKMIHFAHKHPYEVAQRPLADAAAFKYLPEIAVTKAVIALKDFALHIKHILPQKNHLSLFKTWKSQSPLQSATQTMPQTGATDSIKNNLKTPPDNDTPKFKT